MTDIYKDAGISRVRLHEIVAFTPTAVTMKAVEAALGRKAKDGWTQMPINARLYLNDESQWKEAECLPSRERAKTNQVLMRPRGNLVIRLLKDGTSTVLRTRRDVRPDDLIADGEERIPNVERFVVTSITQLLDGHSRKMRTRSLITDCEPSVGLPLDGQPPYPVTEIELIDIRRLGRLVSDDVDESLKQLHKLLLYAVARNHRLRGAEINLRAIADEVLADVLDDGVLLHNLGDRLCLRNLSQGDRVFIAFGRRGTVVAHTRSRDSLQIRCTVLSMVETLRSRFQNLLVASAMMDTLLLRMAQLLETRPEDPPSKGEIEAAKEVLGELGKATSIYGLSVTDPGVQLLEGSIISLMAGRAEAYFEIQNLRHACQQKMEAIRTIWATYQDRRRQTLLRALGIVPGDEEGMG